VVPHKKLAADVALRLIAMGARLLADDQTQLFAEGARLFAESPSSLHGRMEIRGVGIVVLEAIQKANRELGTLTVIITHNAVMADMADRVIHLSDLWFNSIRTTEKCVPASGLVW